MPTIFDSKSKKQPKKVDRRLEATEEPLIHSDSHAIQSVEKLMRSKHNSMSLFAAYAMHPRGVNFANQEPDETILLFLRRHFITNTPWILLTILLILIPPVFFSLLTFLPPLSFPPGITIVLTIFYYLMLTSYAFGRFISWFYNIGVVTQKRIVDLDSHNILAHNTATANFNEIVDVKFKQHGFLQSTFDYGDIHIQTEAINANFEFLSAPKPTIVTDIMSDLRIAQPKNNHGNL